MFVYAVSASKTAALLPSQLLINKRYHFEYEPNIINGLEQIPEYTSSKWSIAVRWGI